MTLHPDTKELLLILTLLLFIGYIAYSSLTIHRLNDKVSTFPSQAFEDARDKATTRHEAIRLNGLLGFCEDTLWGVNRAWEVCVEDNL